MKPQETAALSHSCGVSRLGWLPDHTPAVSLSARIGPKRIRFALNALPLTLGGDFKVWEIELPRQSASLADFPRFRLSPPPLRDGAFAALGSSFPEPPGRVCTSSLIPTRASQDTELDLEQRSNLVAQAF